MLTAEVAAALKAAAESLYSDRFSAFRHTAEGSGIVEQGEDALFEDAPCYVSRLKKLFGGDGTPDPDESCNRVTGSLTVFHSGDHRLEDGDRVVIVKEGEEYRGIAGRSFAYPSHCETTVRIERVV